MMADAPTPTQIAAHLAAGGKLTDKIVTPY